MSRPLIALTPDAWRASQTRSFYNSPAYAEFLTHNGGTLLWEDLGDGFLVPVIQPNVWTWWKNTKIPVPPKWGPRQSGFVGMHAQNWGADNDIDAFVNALKGRKRFQAPVQGIQPALTESGLLPGLPNLEAQLGFAGLNWTKSETRIIEVPEPGSPDLNELFRPDLNSFLTDEPTAQQLVESYDSRRRYDIRRALRLGVTVSIHRVDSNELARDIYGAIHPMHRDSVARTGLGGHTLDYWVGLSAAVRASGGTDIVAVAKDKEGEIVSVVVAHQVGVSTIYQMNSSSNAGLKLSANPITLHGAIVAATHLGTRYFETGRIHAGDPEKSHSIYAYKEQFGGTTYPVPNYVL